MNGGFQHTQNLGFMAQQTAMQNRVKVGVRGWQNATRQDLVNFVSRKTRTAISDSHVEGDLVIGFVNNRQDADALLNWNGVRFAGNALKFEIINDNGVGGAPGTSSTITLLKNFLYKRYNGQNKMLDLGNIRNDPDLVSNGLFSSTSTQSKMFPAMMKLASKEPQLVVESMNLSNNNLRDVNMISSIAQTFPNLKNLCLANNQISKFRSLEIWKGKFKQLRELLMMNNPVTTDPLYRTEMLRLFPKLVILDNILLRDENKLQQLYSVPMKIQQFFFENNELGQSSTDFVSNFLTLWDTNRTQLMGLYTPQSQFSISVDSSVPSSSVPNSDQNPTFSFYLPLSRNLTKVSSEKTKQQRLAVGQEAIDSLFRSLPKSKHFLQEQPSNYSLEAWSYPQVQGFIITLHGFFEEVDKPEIDANKSTSTTVAGRHRRFNHGHANNSLNKLSKRSFDRTWIIVPNQGSVIVASDLFTVRPYCDGSWTEPQLPQPTGDTVQPPTLAQPGLQQPGLQQPGLQQPGLQQPGLQQPGLQQPGLQQPGLQQPGLQQPGFQQPGLQQPGLQQPGLQQPGLQQPGIQPPNNHMGLQPGAIVPPTGQLLLPPEVQAKLNPVQQELLNKLHFQTKLNAEYTYMLAEQSGWNYDIALKGFQDSVNNIPRQAFI